MSLCLAGYRFTAGGPASSSCPIRVLRTGRRSLSARTHVSSAVWGLEQIQIGWLRLKVDFKIERLFFVLSGIVLFLLIFKELSVYPWYPSSLSLLRRPSVFSLGIFECAYENKNQGGFIDRQRKGIAFVRRQKNKCGCEQAIHRSNNTKLKSRKKFWKSYYFTKDFFPSWVLPPKKRNTYRSSEHSSCSPVKKKKN